MRKVILLMLLISLPILAQVDTTKPKTQLELSKQKSIELMNTINEQTKLISQNQLMLNAQKAGVYDLLMEKQQYDNYINEEEKKAKLPTK